MSVRSEGARLTALAGAASRRFLAAEEGPTAVEYAIMLALIIVGCVTIVASIGTTASGTFSQVNSTLSS
jgi:pilus assembly protein Flp/PilA